MSSLLLQFNKFLKDFKFFKDYKYFFLKDIFFYFEDVGDFLSFIKTFYKFNPNFLKEAFIAILLQTFALHFRYKFHFLDSISINLPSCVFYTILAFAIKDSLGHELPREEECSC